MLNLERRFGHDQINSPVGRWEIACGLQQLYVATLPLMEASCGPNEIPAGDGYLVEAANMLWELWMATGNDGYFWKAVVPMESALAKCKHDYNIRFMLIKFYNHAGNGKTLICRCKTVNRP